MEKQGYSVERTYEVKLWFEKSNFKKSGVNCKGFLRQTQGTKVNSEKLGNSNNRIFEKLGFNCTRERAEAEKKR